MCGAVEYKTNLKLCGPLHSTETITKKKGKNVFVKLVGETCSLNFAGILQYSAGEPRSGESFNNLLHGSSHEIILQYSPGIASNFPS